MKTQYDGVRTTKYGRPRTPLEISMTPMIDVIFLLLVYFLAASSMQVIEQLLPGSVSEMASASGDQVEPPPEIMEEIFDQVIIQLSVTGNEIRSQLNGAPVAFPDELQARLALTASAQVDVPVVIDPAPAVPMQWVVKVYDMARSSGLSRVYLATRETNRQGSR